MRLQNKVAIVTGGSRGIGSATVEAFLRENIVAERCALSVLTVKGGEEA